MSVIDEELMSSVTFAAGEPLARIRAPKRVSGARRRIGAPHGDIVAAQRAPHARASAPSRWRARLLALGLLTVASITLGLARPSLMLSLLPRLAPGYAAVGLKVNLRGFEFEAVSARLEQAGGGRFLAVEGRLRNLAAEPRDAPRLRVTLSDGEERPVYFWATSTGIKSLQPGISAPFRALLAAPPAEARSVTVDFAP